MGINWLSSLRRRFKSSKPQQIVAPHQPMLEPLEGRQLLASAAAVVTSTLADNRGHVEIRFNKALSSKTVTKTSVRLFTAGTDNIFETSDDVVITSTVSYNSSKKMISITGAVPVDRAYRVKLYSSRIKDVDGLRIDGEFKTGGKSGNGAQGGDYMFRVRRDTGATPIVRFTSNVGDIDVRMFRGASSYSTIATPLNVAHFLSFVNAATWDNLFINRLVNGFVAQMGGMFVTSNGQQINSITRSPGGTTPGEPGNSNVLGTIAFALPSGSDSQNQAGNEFFFNLQNNDGSKGTNLNDDSTGGGPFTVFGKVSNSKGLAVLAAISKLHRLDLSAELSGDPQGYAHNEIAVTSSVPINKGSESIFAGGKTSKNPLVLTKDLVVFSRISVLSKVVAA